MKTKNQPQELMSAQDDPLAREHANAASGKESQYLFKICGGDLQSR